MYTLHKLLKGRRKEERKRRSGKSSELLTQKENEDIVNILASTSTGTLGGWGWVGLCDSRWVRKRQTSKCLCVFTEECSTRHQLRQLLANKYTLHHENKYSPAKYNSQALSNMLIANITFLAFHTL